MMTRQTSTFARLWRPLLTAGMVLTIAACQGLPLGTVFVSGREGTATVSPSTLAVTLNVATGFAAKAQTPKAIGDVDHYTVKLYDWTGAALGSLRHTYPTTGGTASPKTVNFTNVLPGDYKITAEAFSSADDTVSITQGGPQTSTNVATVADGSNPTYTAPGGGLTVSLPLIDGVGDNVSTTLTVTNGRPPTEGGMAPDDIDSPTAIHDYTITKGAVTSTFVWIPRFAAFQLKVPANCGSTGSDIHFTVANTARPVGYWVAGPTPPAGTPGTDWEKYEFGGFYAGKYEASRSNATAASDGSATALSVRQGVVTWANINWDQAAKTCAQYHPNAHLMTDNEWTALAVNAMINDVTVRGNNNGAIATITNADADIASIAFTGDGIVSGRAITGSGPASTAHTGTAAGVYDLHGNLMEWTMGTEFEYGSEKWFIDLMDVGTTAPTATASIQQLATHSALAPMGLPQAGTGSGSFGNDGLMFTIPGGKAKNLRGGDYSSSGSGGLWAVAFSNARNETAEYISFRPALRF